MGFFSKLFSPVTTNKSNSPVLKANRNRVLCACYSVKGKNPNTHRIKKETVVVPAVLAGNEVGDILHGPGVLYSRCINFFDAV